MSKERARRRAEREAAAAKAAELNEARMARRSRRQATVGRVTGGVAGRLPGRAAGPGTIRRRRRIAAVVAVFVALQAAAWLFGLPGQMRFAVFLVSLLVTPVVAFALFDRR